ELWDEMRARISAGRLWLIGEASERVRNRCSGRDDILLLGRLPSDEVLAHVANFDIALYPRTKDQGVSAMKVAEYMSVGVPTVSIAMATLNGERYLLAQLESLESQTLLPAELVVSDDGSTDETLRILSSFARTSRMSVRVVATGPRLGYAGNFERALRHCV